MKTRERILLKSIDIFNQSGVSNTSTNHIAKELGMSPGNLYFHFENKEEILRDLFERMCNETYQNWSQKNLALETRLEKVLLSNFDVYWRYRFFHREIYQLRRQDPKLNVLWRNHLKKVIHMMRATYRFWAKKGWVRKVNSREEVDLIIEVIMVTASSYLQFYEDSDRAAKRRRLHRGMRHLNLFLKLVAA